MYRKITKSFYLCHDKIIMDFCRLVKTKHPPIMKNRSIIALALLAIVITITSCASQKYGCPTNLNSTSKFKG